MNDQRFRRGKWVILLFGILMAGMVGVLAYNAGVAHGVAMGAAVEQGGGVAAAAAYHHAYGPYGWHPWGYGFGFFPVFPLFAVFFFLFALRFLFWGGPWRRHWHDGDPHGLPRRFEEWHRRAHERAKDEPPATHV